MRQRVNIAIVTLSGSAYYRFAEELKRRKMMFLSLTPDTEIPVHVDLVLTTKTEKSSIDHPNIIAYEEDENVDELIDQALQFIYGRQKHRRMIIGVDPGKSWGVSAVVDGRLICSSIHNTMRDTEDEIIALITRVAAEEYIVKIGNGSEPYHSQLMSSLDKDLPRDIAIESVCEEGTSSDIIRERRESRIDAISAELISSRKGKRISR